MNAELQQVLKPRDNSAVMYAPNPPSRRANQVPYVMNSSQSNKSQSAVSPMERGEWICVCNVNVLRGPVSSVWPVFDQIFHETMIL